MFSESVIWFSLTVSLHSVFKESGEIRIAEDIFPLTLVFNN